MPLVTCGLSDEGVVAEVFRFSTTPELIQFEEDSLGFEFGLGEVVKEFDQDIVTIDFEIKVIRVEECSIDF